MHQTCGACNAAAPMPRTLVYFCSTTFMQCWYNHQLTPLTKKIEMNINTLLLAALLAGSASCGLAAEALIPVDSFVREPEYTQPRLSPDGKHIAINVRIKRNGRMIPTMTVYSLPELKVVSTIAMPGFTIPVDFIWVTNRRLVVSKGMEVGLREPPVPTGELIAVDLDGTHQEYLYGYENFQLSSRGARYGDDYGYGEVVHVPDSRNGHVLAGTYLWGAERSTLYDIDSSNSNRKLVADIGAEFLDFVVQNNGKPRFAYGFDEQFYAVLYRLDDESGAWKVIKDNAIGRSFKPLIFSADDKSFYALHSPAGGPEIIVREATQGGARTVVAEDKFGSINLRQYTPKPFQLFGVGSEVGIPKLRYLDESLPEAKLHKDLSAQFADSIVTFINFTDDGGKLLFYVASDRDPGSYYLYDRKSNKANLLFSNLEYIVPEQMSERRPIQFNARDGLTLTGYLTLPKSGGKKMPMVMLPHGGPQDIHETWQFDLDAQFLASRGYAVLQVNFRGSGGRGPAFKEAGQREWGGKMIDDMVDAVKFAGAMPEIDINRVCIFGTSYGGYAALMAPVREPALFKCAVGFAGPYDLAYIFDEPRSKRKKVQNFLTRWLGTDKQELARYSPTAQADKIKIPVLLVHGEKDEIVTIEHTQRMRASLVKAGRPPEMMLVPNEGHGFYDADNRRAFYLKLEQFLGKYIGK